MRTLRMSCIVFITESYKVVVRNYYTRINIIIAAMLYRLYNSEPQHIEILSEG